MTDMDRVDDESLSRAWIRAMGLRQQIAATAASIAETEDWVADTLDRLALVRPHDAERLRERATNARLFAARERNQAAIYRAYASLPPPGRCLTHVWVRGSHRNQRQWVSFCPAEGGSRRRGR